MTCVNPAPSGFPNAERILAVPHNLSLSLPERTCRALARIDRRRRHLALSLVGEGQRVAHKVHAATLPNGLEHPRGRGLYSLVAIAKDQLD